MPPFSMQMRTNIARCYTLGLDCSDRALALSLVAQYNRPSELDTQAMSLAVTPSTASRELDRGLVDG